ncbi:FAD-dependent oxidoreductase [Anabaena cylindrica FACHB-243]|uniref:Pyridine nucleotide-disulfide oxidoreductase family protein n=1 Tax=Anabaena cylindrica (strain ATCC 27899 / PCC 7122) TaxID=272123 RepID=K9ZB96_ANACC|nr:MULTISPECIES: FAD-dependent oxidoreductase [Anabaena]AFZ55650.1 Pyridine nucleotide-disulfide oxidoreductase family protein [Anabaena cylindrica PCC 7122]MBD2420411.1 FAD-dependent oxidoreductase [Anabaena cylindrica FACHB-243]MBY5281744.1 FAD-dependent oxidoreductase [Anabaena sp. CCAP 1446/1C]MBY5310082.1 FAD-dependent oxidoreductase [Anabaena sp. CCAP 1446/1C]MCM2406963.1 FAD-dependent oxidoreductase [Anabaena sp. CCAP 1446/1C]
MQQNCQPILKKLVLIGGGHSHAIILRLLGNKPLPGLHLTLITPDKYTPYSGMLPGHIAGFYNYAECHIDLENLSNFAHVNLYFDRVVGLDLQNNKVICANRPAVDFDLLSIDIGSTPAKLSVSGAAEYAVSAKPVAKLLEHWDKLQKNAAANPQKQLSISIVGGGAGGVELALSMQAGLQKLEIENLEVHLFQRGGELMPNHHPSVRRIMQRVLNHKGVKLHLGETVCQVAPINEKFEVKCESGLIVECNQVFWVTQASAPDWIKASGIGTDEQGFILVDDNLKSLTHSHIFAAGDIATMVNYHLPKAGVFAVRQGKPLYENLCRMVLGKSLKPYKPQKAYLSLISTGDGSALATRGNFTLPPHQLLWHWKDCLDRRFMARFQSLPKT